MFNSILGLSLLGASSNSSQCINVFRHYQMSSGRKLAPRKLPCCPGINAHLVLPIRNLKARPQRIILSPDYLTQSQNKIEEYRIQKNPSLNKVIFTMSDLQLKTYQVWHTVSELGLLSLPIAVHNSMWTPLVWMGHATCFNQQNVARVIKCHLCAYVT